MPLVIHFQYHQLLFRYLNEKIGKDFSKKRNAVSNKIIQEHIHHYISTNANKIDGADFLLGLQSKLEAEMAIIISKRSVYYWLHLYRRIGVVKTFGESGATLSLYRDILEIAFKKYGRETVGHDLIRIPAAPKKEDLCIIANGLYIEALEYFGILDSMKHVGDCIALQDFHESDYLEIYTLECLAFTYWYTTSCLRRLYKGGKFLIRIGYPYVFPFCVEADTKLTKLMNSFDTRNRHFGELSTSSGIVLGNTADESKLNMVVPLYNIERYNMTESGQDILFQVNPFDVLEEKFIPNFIWGSIDFNWYYIRNASIKEAFQRKYYYSMESFVATIYLILYGNYIDSCGNSRAEISLQRAYRYFDSITALHKSILSLASAIQEYIPFSLKPNELRDILQDLFLPSDRSIISLSTRGPQYPLFNANDTLIVDYWAIYNVLKYKMHGLESGDETKGHDFEDYVQDRLKSKGFSLWECQKELKHSDKSSKEIDISFIYEGYLFIGELKCHTMSASYDIGDPQTLNYRQAKLEKALKQAMSKACWLQNHTKGTNFTIPSDVHTIVPFVVSPFVEYIWEASDDLWLTESIPRICTPAECELLCSKENIQEISTKPFLIKSKT